MSIERVVVRNYRALRNADVSFGSGTNIIVGDNEAGKSTLLEAINLALKGQINRRAIAYELHPYLLNAAVQAEFVESHRLGKPVPPPEICVELYLADTKEVAALAGTNNSLKLDVPGISLKLKLDEGLKAEYERYVADPSHITGVPIEYYTVEWLSFANDHLSIAKIPLKTALIDPASISNSYSANKYVLEVVRDHLSKDQAVGLALAYRRMRESFQGDPQITRINVDLSATKSLISEKALTVELDTTARSSWESGVLPHLDNIPLPLVGKGEQNSIKIKLAVSSESDCDVLLLEEPENHLSHTNLGKLASHLANHCAGKQLIVSTHSSFVLNRLGIEHVIMFSGKKGVTLKSVPPDTQSFFKRLPGHDTLRMILAKRTILVEGPSDDLIVQKAYKQKYGKLPLEQGVEVISVGTSFRRFLDIAKLLEIEVAAIRDNDGDPAHVKSLFKAYEGLPHINISIDSDATNPTLEPQLIRANGLANLNAFLGTECSTEEELLTFMTNNKTDYALRIVDHAGTLAIPQYIADAIG